MLKILRVLNDHDGPEAIMAKCAAAPASRGPDKEVGKRE
jgi:hypothetical protein